MAREINTTNESIQAILQAFRECVAKTSMADGKIHFDYTFGTIQRRAKIQFAESAWIKMQTLIREFDTEIGWDGICKRGEGDTYIVSDILVHPQTVTGATVRTDREEYSKWFRQFVDNDEVFCNLRFQGHSHVNMGVTPSGTDTADWKGLLDDLGPDDFYLFMIWNKRGEKTVRLYDFAKNTLFETADCDIEVLDGPAGIVTFLKDARTQVKTATVAAAAAGTTHYGYAGYGGYGGYGQTQIAQAPAANAAKTDKKEKGSGWRRKNDCDLYDRADEYYM